MEKLFRLKKFVKLSFILLCVCFSACMEKGILEKNKSNVDIFSVIDSLNIPLDSLSILIQKKDFRLTVWYNDAILKEYPVVFGWNHPIDKKFEGDKCTPEGIFKVVRRSSNHQYWTKFLELSYPNEISWKNIGNILKNRILKLIQV